MTHDVDGRHQNVLESAGEFAVPKFLARKQIGRVAAKLKQQSALSQPAFIDFCMVHPLKCILRIFERWRIGLLLLLQVFFRDASEFDFAVTISVHGLWMRRN